MANSIQIENHIQEIRNAFQPSDLEGSRAQILSALRQFERKTLRYQSQPGLDAIIKWHKNRYLQKTEHFTRSEELLDEALTRLEECPEAVFNHWRLKTSLSLGYNHRSQHNYLDAEFYLNEALKLSLTESDLARFQGEIYSQLAVVNLDLNRYNRAIKYVTLGKNKGYDLYHSNGRFGLIYAFALVDFCRVTRLIEASDPRVPEYLDEAIKIFDKMGHKTGALGARLERTQWQAITKSFDKALDNSDKLAKRFQEAGLNDEYLETGLLIAKIHKIMYDYEQANEKIDQLLAEALEMGLGRDRISADLWFIKGTIFTAYNLDRDAFESFRESAKIGMALGLKSIIIRAFNAARKINPYPAKELITSDLVYQDAMFVRDRLRQKVTPFATRKTKAKLFASTLFLDIAGFSNIMQKSDEDMTVAMIDELIDRLCLIIYRNKGYIDKFLGNGFMAIFEHGEQPDPDTAYRAVRSGVDILRSLNHKNRKLRQAYGINKKIEIRMGISTGEIYAMVLGNYIKREYTYLGNAVNLAAKLESLASKYQILIDQETFQQTSDRIMAKREDVTIADLGDLEAYQVIRLSRLAEREEYPEAAVEEPA